MENKFCTFSIVVGVPLLHFCKEEVREEVFFFYIMLKDLIICQTGFRKR